MIIILHLETYIIIIVSVFFFLFFFFNDTATTEIYTLSLHDALPILSVAAVPEHQEDSPRVGLNRQVPGKITARSRVRSEEHTSELQSQSNLVCRLLLEKKKKKNKKNIQYNKQTKET